MTGSGNDFVMLDGRFTSPEKWPATRVAAICDRRSGVGADGMVILTPDAPGRVRMTYWNSDGSRAAMCGNAALCSARLAVYLELAEPGDLCLLTDAGVVPARSDGAGDGAEIRLPDAEIPVAVPGLDPASGEHWLAFGMVGVPHLVVRVDDIERIDLPGRGRALRFDARLGEAGANVNFVAPGISEASPGRSGPTSAAWRARRWPAAPGRSPRPWPWRLGARPACRSGSAAGEGPSSW